MATGQEHFREAERLLGLAETRRGAVHEHAVIVAEAQVHALLAIVQPVAYMAVTK